MKIRKRIGVFIGTFVAFSGIREESVCQTQGADVTILYDFEDSTDSGGRAYSQAGWSGSVQLVKTAVSP